TAYLEGYRLVFRYGEGPCQPAVGARGAYLDFVAARIRHVAVTFHVEVPEIARRQDLERDASSFARSQRYTLHPSQLLQGTSGIPIHRPNVKLHHLVPCVFADVG